MLTNFANEFKLYENLFNEPLKKNLLVEDFKVKCPSCNSEVITDNTFMCPNCSSKYLLDEYITESVLDINSPWILIYNKNGIIGKSNINTIVNPLGKTIVAHVTKKFFDSVKPVARHKITPKNSNMGGFTLEDLDKTTATIVKRALELSKTEN